MFFYELIRSWNLVFEFLFQKTFRRWSWISNILRFFTSLLHYETSFLNFSFKRVFVDDQKISTFFSIFFVDFNFFRRVSNDHDIRFSFRNLTTIFLKFFRLHENDIYLNLKHKSENYLNFEKNIFEQHCNTLFNKFEKFVTIAQSKFKVSTSKFKKKSFYVSKISFTKFISKRSKFKNLDFAFFKTFWNNFDKSLKNKKSIIKWSWNKKLSIWSKRHWCQTCCSCIKCFDDKRTYLFIVFLSIA